MSNYPVDVHFTFALDTEDGVSLHGEGMMEGLMIFDAGTYVDPPWEEVEPDLQTLSIEYVWMDPDDNEVEGSVGGRMAYELLEAYGWDVESLSVSDWREVDLYDGEY